MGIFDFIDTLKLIQLKHIGAKNACMTQYIMHLRASYISYSNEKLKNIIDNESDPIKVDIAKSILKSREQS